MSSEVKRQQNSRLRDARLRRGWSQQDLAERMETAVLTISRWERGETRPSARLRLQLCSLFGMDAQELGLLPQDEDEEKAEAQDQEDVALTTIPETPPALVPQPVPPVAARTKHSNRSRMLAKVRAFWIREILNQSLYEAVLITLGLQTRLDAVINPWSLVVQPLNTDPTILPVGTSITQVYDEAEGELLILGEPGSGKTTLLLELARDLLDRAEQDEAHPMPVVFNLSSWPQKQLPLADWLSRELTDKYQVPYKLAQTWVKSDLVLPLLDGLDEVAIQHRAACVDAINAYRREHGLLPTVVCCRSADYMQQEKRVLLRSAVCTQPLTAQQIDTYFSCLGEQLAPLRQALQRDPVLQELATSPLMLNVLTLTYHDKSLEDLPISDTLEEERTQIFTAYVERMLQRRNSRSSYSPRQTIHYLAYLARQMVARKQTIFYIEHMQSDWLPQGRARLIYELLAERLTMVIMGAILCWGSSFALIGPDNVMLRLTPTPFYLMVGGLIGGWLSGRNNALVLRKKALQFMKRTFVGVNHLKNGLLAAGTVGLGMVLTHQYFRLYEESIDDSFISSFVISCAVMGSLISVISSNKGIQPVETLSWSWRYFRHSLVSTRRLKNTVLIMVLLGSLNWPHSIRSYGLILGLITEVVAMLTVGIFFWLLFGIYDGLFAQSLDEYSRINPNDGIRKSLHYSFLVGIISIFTVSFIYTLICIPTLVFDTSLSFTLVGVFEFAFPIGFIVGLAGGLFFGLLMGGLACIRHSILRLLLFRLDLIPWNYPRFLDDAAEQILLRKIGGGYIFIHRLLMEHFAECQDYGPFLDNHPSTPIQRVASDQPQFRHEHFSSE